MESRTEGESIHCVKLLHVVCLPFNITAPDHKSPVCLDAIAKSLEGTPWKAGASPGLADGSVWDDFRRYQARVYFHPFVRRFLYDKNRVRRFYREDVERIDIELPPLEAPLSIRVDVRRCELVLFQPDIGLLLLEISPQKSLALQETQSLLDSFRRLYPPYVDSYEKTVWFGGHCPFKVTLLDGQDGALGECGTYKDESPSFMDAYKESLLGEDALESEKSRLQQYPWAGHWRTLLAPFDCLSKDANNFRAQHLGDDRAPVLSWLALDNLAAVDRGNWMRTCFVDPPNSDTLPYASEFMSGFEKKYCYDRYWYAATDGSSVAPSRILNCGYAFSYVGHYADNDDGFFTNDRNGAQAIFRHIYVEMGLIAHFQKAALLSASQRLSELVSRQGNAVQLPNQREVRDFYDGFVEFTQNFWFDEISPQEQGQELFQMWREHLHIQELYDEVRQELKDLVAYTELRATDNLNRIVLTFGAAGIIVAALSLLAGLFGMNDIDKMCWLIPPQMNALMPCASDSSVQAVLGRLGFWVAMICLLGVPVYLVFKKRHGNRNLT